MHIISYHCISRRVYCEHSFSRGKNQTVFINLGIPRRGYGQSYYTIRSVFLDRIPPPTVHMHLRLFDVSKSFPIGNASKTKSSELLDETINETDMSTEVEIPEEDDRAVFDEWLRNLWRHKVETWNNIWTLEHLYPKRLCTTFQSSSGASRTLWMHSVISYLHIPFNCSLDARPKHECMTRG